MADILVRNRDVWDLYEVKASTSVKPQHKPDAAIQWYVIQDQLPLGKAHIVHVNSDYEFNGELDGARAATRARPKPAIDEQYVASE
jgi:hypothetical protein